MSLRLILEILAAVCFFVAAIGFSVTRPNLIALGLLLWLLSTMGIR